MTMHEFLIEELKQKKGLISTIGRRAKIKSTTIQNWITGGNMPPIDKAEKVLNAMGFEIRIVEGTESENKEVKKIDFERVRKQ